MERCVANLNWQEFAELIEDIKGVILPIGTMEAHGCTNLGTDITIPEYLAGRLAEELDLLIAPSVNYGITRTLLPYPGSMTVEPESFKAYVYDVAESLIETGFEWILFLNGHGGHIDELAEIARELWRVTGGKSIVIHWWTLCEEITKQVLGEAGGHAGINETYMVMAANPELVNESRYEPNMAHLVRSGAFPYPNPGTILLYEKGQGLPRFVPEEAKAYADAVTDEIARYIADVLANWKNNFAQI
ncbi:creatininase family protein [bacterium]|nr:MAG: creatininase family protein [bacterium]